MITPLQQTASIAVSDLMRSMVETIEERHREEQEKANGTKKDETIRTQPQPDQSHRVANEKISAYLFGAMKPDGDAFASLVSRFSSALGITQENDESNAAFAQRLQDALTLTDGFEKTGATGKATTISLKSFGVSEAQVVEVLNNGVTAKTALHGSSCRTHCPKCRPDGQGRRFWRADVESNHGSARHRTQKCH